MAALCGMDAMQYLPESIRYMQQFLWAHPSPERKRYLHHFGFSAGLTKYILVHEVTHRQTDRQTTLLGRSQ